MTLDEKELVFVALNAALRALMLDEARALARRGTSTPRPASTGIRWPRDFERTARARELALGKPARLYTGIQGEP